MTRRSVLGFSICLVWLAIATGAAQAQQLQPVPSLGTALSAGQLPPRDNPRPGYHSDAASGVATSIGGVTRWGPDCQPRPPTLVIVEPPQHGIMGMQDEPARIDRTDANGNPVSCAGYPTVRKALYYQSNPGFRGADRVVYGTEHGKYVVDIWVR